MTVALKPNDAAVPMLLKAFPGYSGRKFRITIHNQPGMSLTSCWDGGSRSYYQVIRLADGAGLAVPENGSGFTAVDQAYGPAGLPEAEQLPCPGFAVVEHSIFCGQDSGLTMHIHADNAAPLLPAPIDLTREQKIVLIATRAYKSSYAGISDYRFVEAQRETGITRAQWDEAKASLIARGMLNKAGAITVDGKNAVSGQYDLWKYRPETKLSADRQVGATDVEVVG